jgi:NAD(P)-dependent dehydrogenase (short-subunit alcohol dehydrogenase family)
MLSSLASR